MGANVDARAVVRPGAVEVGVMGMALVGATFVVRLGRFGMSAFFGHTDATLYADVARQLFGNNSALRATAASNGDAYRYGRVLFPLLSWLGAAGRPAAVPWAMMGVVLLSFGLVVACGAEIALRAGRSPRWGLALLAAPGLWVAALVLVAEPLELGLILLCYLLYADGRSRPCLVVAGLALLTKETAVLALLPLVAFDLRRRGWEAVSVWCAPVAGLLAWWAVVRVNIGAWPFLERSIDRSQAVGLPFTSYLAEIRHGIPGGHAHLGQGITAGVAFAVLALAVAAVVARPSNLVAWGGLALAVLVPVYGANAVVFPSELARLVGPAEGLVIAALIGGGALRPDGQRGGRCPASPAKGALFLNSGISVPI